MLRLNQDAIKQSRQQAIRCQHHSSAACLPFALRFNLALVLLVLVVGCSKSQQLQPGAPLSEPSPPSTQVSEAPKAQEALPTADANGDYPGKIGHQKWIVVDPDPNGVNCRWSKEMPTNWYAPDAKLPTLDINNWSVVRRFTKNTPNQNLTANLTPAGFATLEDESGKPWLKVSLGANEQICLVRANSKYVQPVGD